MSGILVLSSQRALVLAPLRRDSHLPGEWRISSNLRLVVVWLKSVSVSLPFALCKPLSRCAPSEGPCVHVQGVYGWRVHPTVLSYASYQRGDPPPEPEPFQPESVDPARAKAELAQLGIRMQ